MSTPITEAHRELAQSIAEAQRGYTERPDEAAQLIADSEARAVQIAMLREYGNLCATNESLAKERDQLRDLLTEWKVSAHIKGEAIDSLLIECDRLYAEVERLTSVVLRKNGTIDGTEEMLGGLKQGEGYWDMVRRVVATAARAERAEASLHALRLVCGTTDADKFSTWVDRANARAEKAEAELTFQRERNSRLFEQRDAAVAAQEKAEAELANIRALADRRNKRDHSQDTTHQLVAALDQALDIAQAELAQFRELDAERARMRQIAVDKRIRTPTPRTDEEAGSLIDAEEVVPADFARELERENAALRADKARLDWLEKARPIAWALGSEECGEYWILTDTGEKHPEEAEEFATIRAAIDAEMKEGAK